MRVLVTGGAGFIGSHVSAALVERGHEVTVLDNLSSGLRENVPGPARFVCVDITHAGEVRTIVQRAAPDVVFHLAAQTNVAASIHDPLKDAAVNVLGTLAVVSAAVAARCRKLVFASSSTVYGSPRWQPVAETHPLVPISPYGASKLAGEAYVRVLCGYHGVAFTILRFGNVFGERDSRDSRHVITAFITALLDGQRPIIEWDGEQAKDFVYVRDVAAANLAALDSGDAECFNIASGKATSVNAIFHLVSSALGRSTPPLRGEMRPGDVRRFVFDCSKAKQLLNWEAITPLSSALTQTAAFYSGSARHRQPRMNQPVAG